MNLMHALRTGFRVARTWRCAENEYVVRTISTSCHRNQQSFPGYYTPITKQLWIDRMAQAAKHQSDPVLPIHSKNPEVTTVTYPFSTDVSLKGESIVNQEYEYACVNPCVHHGVKNHDIFTRYLKAFGTYLAHRLIGSLGILWTDSWLAMSPSYHRYILQNNIATPGTTSGLDAFWRTSTRSQGTWLSSTAPVRDALPPFWSLRCV